MLQLKACRWSPWGGRPLLQDVALYGRGYLCNFVWLIPLPTESGTGDGPAFASVLDTLDRAACVGHGSGSEADLSHTFGGRHMPVPVYSLPVFQPTQNSLPIHTYHQTLNVAISRTHARCALRRCALMLKRVSSHETVTNSAHLMTAMQAVAAASQSSTVA